MKARSFALALALAATVVGLPACGDDTASDSGSDATTTTAAAAPSISGAWARNSPMKASNGAAYMDVTGGTVDDQITAASVDSTIAGKVELHETVEADAASSSGGMETTAPMDSTTAAGDGSMSTTTLSPAMEMRPVDSIAVPAGTTVSLKPGGYHIMLIDLVKPLVIGDSFELTVTFATAGEQKVQVEVKDAP